MYGESPSENSYSEETGTAARSSTSWLVNTPIDSTLTVSYNPLSTTYFNPRVYNGQGPSPYGKGVTQCFQRLYGKLKNILGL